MQTSSKNYNSNRHKIEFFIYLILFIGIIIVGLYVKNKGKEEDKTLDKKGCLTKGIVVSIRYSTRGEWIRYEYQIDGKKFKDTKNTYKKNIKVGDIYKIEYLPSDPEVNRIILDKKLDSLPQNP